MVSAVLLVKPLKIVLDVVFDRLLSGLNAADPYALSCHIIAPISLQIVNAKK